MLCPMFVPKRDNLGRMKAGWLHKAFGTHVFLYFLGLTFCWMFFYIFLLQFLVGCSEKGGGGVWLATQSTPWICPWERQVVANSKSTVACVYPLHKNNMLSYAEKTPPQRECQDFVTLLYLYIYFLTVFYIIMLLKLYMFVCQYLNKDSTPLSHWLKTTITIQLKLGQAVRRQN